LVKQSYNGVRLFYDCDFARTAGATVTAAPL
jgi:hypothetical protein